jgi:hypothetical protein
VAGQYDVANDEARGKQPRFKSNRSRASCLRVKDVERIMSLRLSILVGSLITVGLWLLVLASAWSFHVWASDYFAETGSVNAGNDLGYSQ